MADQGQPPKGPTENKNTNTNTNTNNDDWSFKVETPQKGPDIPGTAKNSAKPVFQKKQKPKDLSLDYDSLQKQKDKTTEDEEASDEVENAETTRSRIIPPSRSKGDRTTSNLRPGELFEGEIYVPASFPLRVVAYILDYIILGVGTYFFLPADYLKTLGAKGTDLPLETHLMIMMAFLVYFVGCVYFMGGTPGKRILRLKIIHAKSEHLGLIRIFCRETFGKMISGLILGIGYLIPLFNSHHRALHDYICETRVVKG